MAAILAMKEYQEHDWRLESRLKVSEFRLPPDYRRRGTQPPAHVRLTVPVLGSRDGPFACIASAWSSAS